MERLDEKTICYVPQSDYDLFEKLLSETGTKPRNIILVASDKLKPGYAWYNPDVLSSEIVVREIVRNATLGSHGYDVEESFAEWSNPEGSSKISLDKIAEIAGQPNFIHYHWEETSDTVIGHFEELSNNKKELYFEDLKKGILLFSDEWETLKNGERVITFHSSGMGFGYLVETIEVFKVIDGDLHRIRASIID